MADDVAHLRNGFSIRHNRREVIGDKTRLYTTGGFVEIPTEEIVDVEREDTIEVCQADLREASLSSAPASNTEACASTAPAPKSIQDHVTEASKTTGIDADFLNSVIHHESGFNPNAVSRKGAQGLMQLMPETASQLGVRNRFDPGENVQGGAVYLRQLLELYHGDAQKALAAYNAGPLRVRQYNGVPPYRETQSYVAGIIREYNRKKLAEQKAAKEKAAAAKRLASKKPSKATSAAQPGS